MKRSPRRRLHAIPPDWRFFEIHKALARALPGHVETGPEDRILISDRSMRALERLRLDLAKAIGREVSPEEAREKLFAWVWRDREQVLSWMVEDHLRRCAYCRARLESDR